MIYIEKLAIVGTRLEACTFQPFILFFKFRKSCFKQLHSHNCLFHIKNHLDGLHEGGCLAFV